MVDLPKVSNAIVTSQAPTSAVTPGLIQQQANDRAAAIDKQSAAYGTAADALMGVSKDLAKQQAADDLMKQKVTRDADGNVSVENPASAPLIFGDAGKLYQDAIQTGTIAQHSNSLSQDFANLHQQYPTDPAGFKAAADSHLAKTAQIVTGPVGEAVQQAGQQLLTQHFNAITSTAATADLATINSAISANQDSARDDVFAMLRNGAAVTAPAVQGKIAQYDAMTERRAANPLLHYSQEQAQLDRETFHNEATANKFIFDVNQTYKDPNGGYKAALDKAQDILTNPGYGLSQQAREQYYHRAVGEIHTNEAIRKQDLGEARAGFNELTLRSAAGGRIDSDEVEQNAKAFNDAGDPGGASRVRASFIRKPLNDDFSKQPLPMQTQQLAALQGMSAVRGDVSYLINKGYSPAAAAGAASHFVHEGGGDSAAIGDDGTSGGIAQFHNERLDALKTFAAARGKPWTDHTTQLDFVDHELHTTESATLAKLQAAKTPEEATAAFYDYERPAGWKPGDLSGVKDVQSRTALARAIFDGKAGDTSLGPAGSAWFIAHRQAEIDDVATKQWQIVMKDYTTEATRPSLQTVNDVVTAASRTNNAALLEQIAHDTQRMDLARDAGRASIPSQDATIQAMGVAGHAGQLSPGLAAVQKDLQRGRDATVKGLDENPIAHVVGKFSTELGIKDKPALDFSNDDSLAQSLAARGKIAQFGAIKFQTPPLSALDTAEIGQVQGMLANPDPAAKVRIFRALGTLPEDVRSATLAKMGDKDPTAAVDVFAGSLLPENPEVAASILTGLMTTDERFVPSKGANKTAYLAAKDAALPVAAFNLVARTNPTGAFSVMSQAMDARYTSLSAQAGDTSGVPNRTRLKQAADDVTGGILYHGGAPIIAPARGMSQSQFDGVMAGISDADVAGMTTGKGTPISADYLRNSTKLHSLSTGRYLVQVNADDANPKYAAGPGGKPFVLDLRNRPQAAAIAVTGAPDAVAMP